jgi:hypothetical protein
MEFGQETLLHFLSVWIEYDLLDPALISGRGLFNGGFCNSRFYISTIDCV